MLKFLVPVMNNLFPLMSSVTLRLLVTTQVPWQYKLAPVPGSLVLPAKIVFCAKIEVVELMDPVTDKDPDIESPLFETFPLN